MLKVGEVWDVGTVDIKNEKFFFSTIKAKVLNVVLSAGISFDITAHKMFADMALDKLKPWDKADLFLHITPEVLGAIEKGVKGYERFGSTLPSDSPQDITFEIEPDDDMNSMQAGIMSALKERNEKIEKKVSSRGEFKKGSFFHVSRRKYEPGDVIEGSWSSSEELDSMGEILEEVIEEGRPPGAVSRKNCVFVFENYADAANYRDDLRPDSQIYVVEIIGKSTRADMRGVDAINDVMNIQTDAQEQGAEKDYLDELQERRDKEVQLYWSGKPNQEGFRTMWEHICEKVKVVEVVELKEGMVRMSLRALREIVRSGI